MRVKHATTHITVINLVCGDVLSYILVRRHMKNTEKHWLMVDYNVKIDFFYVGVVLSGLIPEDGDSMSLRNVASTYETTWCQNPTQHLHHINRHHLKSHLDLFPYCLI
jgi:hypothetical protein